MGESHENGVVRLKDAIDQALMLRGSRDFNSLEEYAGFVRKVVARRNRLVGGRAPKQSSTRVAASRTPCPPGFWSDDPEHQSQETSARDTTATSRIPGAGSPTMTFRLAYDALREWRGERADVEYVRILHLAATTMETTVDSALALLLEAGGPFDYAVRELNTCRRRHSACPGSDPDSNSQSGVSKPRRRNVREGQHVEEELADILSTSWPSVFPAPGKHTPCAATG